MSTFFSLLFLVALIAGIVMTVQALRRKQKMPRNAKIAFGVMAASFVLFGLTMTPEERQAVQPQASETGTTEQSSNETDSQECLQVSPEVIQAILDGAPGGKLEKVRAIKMTSHPGWYVVAGKFTAPKVFHGESAVNATWVVSEINSVGLTLSAGPFANMGSTWPNAEKTTLHFYGAEPEAMQAIHCVDPSPPVELPGIK